MRNEDFIQEDWERIPERERLLIQLEKEYFEAMEFEEAKIILSNPVKTDNNEEATIQFQSQDGRVSQGIETRPERLICYRVYREQT